MDSFPGSCKRSCPDRVEIIKHNSDDKLSNLPIDVLRHILSFLDSTEVVRTSFLSRKWRYIWTLVPCLNFDFRGFWYLERRQGLNYIQCALKFWEFVKWTLTIREAPAVQKLHLLCDCFDAKQLKLLLCLCAMRNVQELDLLAGFTNNIFCFSQAFSESVLNGLIKLQPSAGFNNLKSLHLVKVWFSDADITEKLFSDCAVLENLSMEYCSFLMIKVLNISAQKLRKLNFVNMGFDNMSISSFPFQGKLKVNTPSLVSFCYIGPLLSHCEFFNLSSLNNALIQVQHELYPRVPCSELGVMVFGLAQAEELSLSTGFVLCFSPAFGQLSCDVIQFHYLRRLKLELFCDAEHMEGLINLLKLSPNLEVLCVKFIEYPGTSFWKSREEDVPCFSHHFKEIEISEFYDSICSMEFVKFFLQNGKSLEKMKITQKKDEVNPKKLYALQAVQLASKAVSVAMISISASGKRELLQFVYRKRSWFMETDPEKTR